MFLVSFIRQLAFTLPAQRLNQKFEIHGNLQFEQIFSQSDTKVVNVISMKKNKVYLMCFVEKVLLFSHICKCKVTYEALENFTVILLLGSHSIPSRIRF